jgi:hypothetical protein
MEAIIYRKFGVNVEFDFYRHSGILKSHHKLSRIKWESINCVIGYLKPERIFHKNYGITVAFKDNEGHLAYYEVISTSNEWEFRYILEKTVLYLKKKYGAIGGESWCTIFEDENLRNYYNSYICCRVLADKKRIGWFEQNDYEDVLVANDFINKVLITDGTESSQLWTAMEKTRLQINKDGSFAINGSYGYQILYDHFIEIQSARNKNK